MRRWMLRAVVVLALAGAACKTDTNPGFLSKPMYLGGW